MSNKTICSTMIIKRFQGLWAAMDQWH